MGSRSHPHRVLSVCVSRCLWVCVIEANSLQLRVITIGLYQFLSRSPSCQILAVFAVVVYGPFWFRDSWALLLPGLRSPDLWLPIASLRYPPLPYGKLRFYLRKAPPLPYGKLSFCLRKAPPLPTKSSTLVSRCVLLLVINSLFRNWILPSSLWHPLHFSARREINNWTLDLFQTHHGGQLGAIVLSRPSRRCCLWTSWLFCCSYKGRSGSLIPACHDHGSLKWTFCMPC